MISEIHIEWSRKVIQRYTFILIKKKEYIDFTYIALK